MIWYEKHSVGYFDAPDYLGKMPQFVGEWSLPDEFIFSCYKVSIFLRQPGYRVDDIIGFHVCYYIRSQR